MLLKCLSSIFYKILSLHSCPITYKVHCLSTRVVVIFIQILVMKTYRQGPVPNSMRYCTDFCCLILFTVFAALLLLVGMYSWKQRNFERLTYPYDPDGKACGIDLPHHPFIYFAAPNTETLWVTTCVSKCPTNHTKALSCHVNSVVENCKQYNDGEDMQRITLYSTEPYQKKICLPTSEALKKIVINGLTFQGMQRRISDSKNSWKVILSCTILAIILGLVFMLVVRLCAGFIIWASIVLAIVALFSFGMALMKTKSTIPIGVLNNHQTARLIGAAAMFIMGTFLVFISCCYCRKISLAGRIVSTATNFVTSECILAFLPLLLFAIMTVFVLYWLALALGFYSLGKPTHIAHSLPFQHFETTPFVKILGGIHIFYLIWGVCFLIETSKFIVAGAATNWYFQDPFPVATSSCRYLIFHMGSVCVGSFLVAIFGFLKIIYNLVTPDPGVTQGCLYNIKRCCDCCFCFCLSTVFDWLNSNAYTWIHLTSNSYCSSAASSMGLQVSNAATSGFMVILTTIFSVVFRLGITVATSLIAYITLKYGSTYRYIIYEPIFPTLLIGLMSFAISSFYVSLYKDASEAIYMCFLAEADAGGSVNCPPELRYFLKEAAEQNNYVV